MRRICSFQNIVFIAIAVYLVLLLVNQQAALSRNIERNRDLKEEIAASQTELEELEQEEEILDTDAYIEEKAREVLGYVKSNETVYIKD